MVGLGFNRNIAHVAAAPWRRGYGLGSVANKGLATGRIRESDSRLTVKLPCGVCDEACTGKSEEDAVVERSMAMECVMESLRSSSQQQASTANVV
jgi:hypothetical protein